MLFLAFANCIMPLFEVRKTGKLNPTTYSGLVLIWQCCLTAQVETDIDLRIPALQDMLTSDIAKSIVGLVSLFKSEIEAFKPF